MEELRNKGTFGLEHLKNLHTITYIAKPMELAIILSFKTYIKKISYCSFKFKSILFKPILNE